MSNGFIRLCSMVFCWAAISACHALLSSHMTNKDDDDDNGLRPIYCSLSRVINHVSYYNDIGLISTFVVLNRKFFKSCCSIVCMKISRLPRTAVST